jgi:hypothetical protein
MPACFHCVCIAYSTPFRVQLGAVDGSGIYMPVMGIGNRKKRGENQRYVSDE